MSGNSANAGMAKTFYGLAIAVLAGFIAYIGRPVLIPLIIAGFLCFLIFTLKENVRTVHRKIYSKLACLYGCFQPDWRGGGFIC